MQWLAQMILSGNAMRGRLPEGFQKLRALFVFNASNNLLSGRLPFENLQGLNFRILHLASNQLSGAFPLQQRFGLADAMILSANKLSGTIPANVFQRPWRMVWLLHCSGNMFEGTFPAVPVTASTNLEALGFAGRQSESQRLLAGTVPQGLSRARRLVGLTAQHNRFESS